MSAPRTPGPWAYLDIGEIVSTDPVDNYPTDDVICVVAGPEHPNADGALIAAAPELYEALEAVTIFAASTIEKLNLTDTNGIIAAANTALAKARDES